MKIAIIAHPEKYSIKTPLISVLSWCEENGVTAFATETLQKLTNQSFPKSLKTVKSEEEAVDNADIIIAIGGDGTMLYTAQRIKEVDKQVLGINSGRLGFMANIQQDLIHSALDEVKNENYLVDERSMLQASIAGKKNYHALNEFLFTKKDTVSLITLTAEYDGMFVNRYWSDGLLISTPTGSTAYNLSTGGPIVMPGTPVMVLTPINPHTLTTRPVVLPSDKILTVKVEHDPEHILFSNDGIIMDIESDPFEVNVSQSKHSVKLIQLKNQNYFDTLRNKLMWGVDSRKNP